MAFTAATYAAEITAAVNGGLAIVPNDPGADDPTAAAAAVAGQHDISLFDPLPAGVFTASYPIASVPADNTRVQLTDSAGATAWATLVPAVAGAVVNTAGAEWQAVRVYAPDGTVRLYLSGPNVNAPGVGAWVAATQVTVVPDAAVTTAQALGATPVVPMSDISVLESEMEQRDAGWSDPKGAGLHPHQ